MLKILDDLIPHEMKCDFNRCCKSDFNVDYEVDREYVDSLLRDQLIIDNKVAAVPVIKLSLQSRKRD